VSMLRPPVLAGHRSKGCLPNIEQLG
jgi:hypothetical protein